MKKVLFLILFAANIYAAAVHAQSGANDSTFNVADDGTLSDGAGFDNFLTGLVIQSDGKIIAIGGFDSLNGISRRSLARLNADESLDKNFHPVIDSYCASLILQKDGKIIIGGSFSTVNGVPRNGIARLNTDGSLDTSFDPGTGFDNAPLSMTIQNDGKIIAGGLFTSYNGTSRNKIVRLHPDGSLDTSFDPGTGFDAAVYFTGIQSDGKIIVGGTFVFFNGIIRYGIARLNPDGSMDTNFKPTKGSSITCAILLNDGKIIVNGDYNSNGIIRKGITRLNTDGSLDTGFDFGAGFSGTSTSAQCIALQPDGKIIAGGNFTYADGVPRNHLTRLHANGAVDTSFNPRGGSNATVRAMAIESDGKIIIGGSFTSFSGILRNYIARLNADGSLAPGLDQGAGLFRDVKAITIQPDKKIIAGGTFTSLNGVRRNHITRLHANGSVDMSFDPGTGFDSYPASLAVQPDGKIIAGGNFNLYNGTLRSRITRINSNGSLDTGFDPGTGCNGDVYAVAIQSDGKIIVAGNFTSFNGASANKIVRLQTDGSLDASFNTGTGFTGDVRSIAIHSDGKIILGGSFDLFNGVTRNKIIRLHTDGSLDTGFDPAAGFNNYVSSVIVQSDGKIIAGGGFSSFNGVTRHWIARLTTDGSLDAGFNAGTLNNANPVWGVWSLSIQNDAKIIMTGVFSSVNGITKNGIARLHPDGSLDTSFDPGTGFNDRAWSIALQSDGKLIVGGSFTSFNGIRRTKIARLLGDGAVTAVSEISNNAGVTIYPNPFCSSTTLRADKFLKNATLTIYNSCGLVVKELKNVSGQSITLQRGNLSAGLYFLSLAQDNDAVITYKLIITDY